MVVRMGISQEAWDYEFAVDLPTAVSTKFARISQHELLGYQKGSMLSCLSSSILDVHTLVPNQSAIHADRC